MTCDYGLCYIFALFTWNGGFVNVLGKKAAQKRIVTGKTYARRKMLQWLWCHEVILKSVIRWVAGNRRHHYQTRDLVGMCAVLGITSQRRQKKSIAVIPRLSPRFRRTARCGCVFHFKTLALTKETLYILFQCMTSLPPPKACVKTCYL